MDPRERADAALARARARGAFVVTPDSAISPMDAASTMEIPKAVVSAIDNGDAEATLVVPAPLATGHPPQAREQHPDERGPAISQQASTQMLRTPSPAPRWPSEEWPEDRPSPRPRQTKDSQPPAMSWAPQPPPPPEPERVDGLVPTVKQPPTRGSSLSQRLDG